MSKSAFVLPSKVYVAGEYGSPLSSVTGQPVRIEEIRAKYNRNNPWTDPDFPPVYSSLGAIGGDGARGEVLDPNSDPRTYSWIRPHVSSVRL